MRRAALLAAGATVGASIFFSQASTDAPLLWIGGAAIIAAAAAAVGVLTGRVPLPDLDRAGLVFVGLLAGLVIWNGVSIVWSALPDRSWDYFNRGLVYLAFLVLGLAVGVVVERAPRDVALLLGGLIGAAAIWALAGKVVPALYEDYGRFARLRSPVGYWNGLAVLMAFGLPLGLWIASVREHARELRAAGVVLLYVLGIALALTYSRGGLLAAVFAVGAYLVLARARVEAIVALGVAMAAAVPALAWGLTQPGVADDFQSRATRVEDGAWFGLIVFLGGLIAYALAWWLEPRRLSERRSRLVLRGAAMAGVVLLLGGAAIALADADGDVVEQGPGRQLSTGSNNRASWWGEAWDAFAGQPLRGVGAGAFEAVHRQLRESKIDVTEPHNLPLQFAAETGILGVALFVGAMAAGLLALWRRRADPPSLALGLMLPTYVLHGLLDYDWDYVAVTAPVLLATGVVLAADRPRRVVAVQPLWSVVAVLVGGSVLFSVVAPRIADRRTEQAFAALDRRDYAEALDLAEEAQSLNPLAVAPLHAEAAAEEARRQFAAAHALYVEAVEKQPLNSATWYELGCFELQVLADQAAARRDLERARDLDPRGPAATALISPGFRGDAQGPPETAPC